MYASKYQKNLGLWDSGTELNIKKTELSMKKTELNMKKTELNMKKTELNMKTTKPSIIYECTNELIIKESIIFKKNKCQSAED